MREKLSLRMAVFDENILTLFYLADLISAWVSPHIATAFTVDQALEIAKSGKMNGVLVGESRDMEHYYSVVTAFRSARNAPYIVAMFADPNDVETMADHKGTYQEVNLSLRGIILPNIQAHKMKLEQAPI